MNRVLILLGLAVFLFQLASNYSKSSQIAAKSFVKLCQNRDSVSKDTKHTIDVLLQKSQTQNCKLADSLLRNLTELNLSEKDIVDLKPLASFTKLTTLNLSSVNTPTPPDRAIVDVQPLANLTNLTELYLFRNQIVDIKPLAGLTNLTSLGLSSNQIVDINPLSKLTNLTELHIYRNKIVDPKPLTELTKLKKLNLSDNSTTIKTCPVNLDDCNF